MWTPCAILSWTIYDLKTRVSLVYLQEMDTNKSEFSEHQYNQFEPSYSGLEMSAQLSPVI